MATEYNQNHKKGEYIIEEFNENGTIKNTC